MNKTAIPVLMFSALSVSANAIAAGAMQPGLWQMSVTLSAEQMATMPKDMKMPGMVGNVMTRQTCITPKEAEDLGMTDDAGTNACKISNKAVVGTTHTMDLTCNSADRKGTGKAKVVFTDSGSFTSVVEFKGVYHGKNVTEHHETAGKWLNANCGSVK